MLAVQETSSDVVVEEVTTRFEGVDGACRSRRAAASEVNANRSAKTTQDAAVMILTKGGLSGSVV